jgi:hypothetical protein
MNIADRQCKIAGDACRSWFVGKNILHFPAQFGFLRRTFRSRTPGRKARRQLRGSQLSTVLR